MQDKKPRTLRVGISAQNLDALGRIDLSPDGAIKFLDRDGNDFPVSSVTSGISYHRNKGPKVTVEVFDHAGTAGMVPATLTEFRRVLAVDTNSRTIGNERVCVATAAELCDFLLEAGQWSCRFKPLWSFEFRGAKEDPEKIGWRDALLRCEEFGWLTEPKTLLVVDAHLGELRSIARRASPVLRDFFLHENARLAYASSDASTDSPLNGLIRICDRISSRLLDLAENAPRSEPALVTVENHPFASCRCWDWAVGGDQ